MFYEYWNEGVKFLIIFLVILLYIVSVYGQHQIANGEYEWFNSLMQRFGEILPQETNYRVYSIEECDKIKEVNERESCYSAVTLMQGDASVCEKIRKDSDNYALCYIQTVYHSTFNGTGTPAMCETIPIVAQDDCYNIFANIIQNVSLCEQYPKCLKKVRTQ